MRKQPSSRNPRHAQDFRGRPVGKSRQRRLFLEQLEVREVMTCRADIDAQDNTLTEPMPGDTVFDYGRARIQLQRDNSCQGAVTVSLDLAAESTASNSEFSYEQPPIYWSSGYYPQITIPANSYSVNFDLNPSNDWTNSTAESTELIKLKIASASGFTFNTNQRATFYLYDNGLDYDGSPDVTLAAQGNPSEPSTNGSFTITRNQDGGFSSPLTVYYSVSTASTAIPDADYDAAPFTSGSVQIPAGESEVSLPLTVFDDTIADGTKTVTLNLGTGSYTVVGTNSATLTIADDDQPSISITPLVNVSEPTNATSTNTAQFLVTLSRTSSVPVTVNYSTSDLTASSVNSADYSANNGSVTFAPTETVKIVEINISHDTLDEVAEEFYVHLSNPAHATILQGQGKGKIVDNDGPLVTLSSPTVAEGGLLTFEVKLVNAAGVPTASVENISLTLTISDVSTDGNFVDYAIDQYVWPIVFVGGQNQTTQTLSIQTADDAVDEIDETLKVTLSNLTGATFVNSANTLEAIGTILDENASPELLVIDQSINEGTDYDIDGTVTVQVVPPSEKPIDFKYSFTSQTAEFSWDYWYFPQIPLISYTIPAGQASASIPFRIKRDARYEGNETFAVSISQPTDATITDATGTVTIIDDDSEPYLTISGGEIHEGQGNISFTVTRHGDTVFPITVDYSTVVSSVGINSAMTPDDFIAVSGSAAGNNALTIQHYETTKTISVAIVSDAVDEATENFRVQLSNPVQAHFESFATTADATGTILDDDGPSVTIDDVSVNEAAGYVDVSVHLSQASPEPILVNWDTRSGTATAGSSADYATGSGTVTFNANDPATTKTVRVTIHNDARDELDSEAFYVDLSLQDATRASLSDSSGTVSISDDDLAPTISLGDATIEEQDGSLVFPLTLSAPSNLTVTLDVSASAILPPGAGNATDPSDFDAATLHLTFNPGATTPTVAASFTIHEDSVDEVTEAFLISLSNIVHATYTGGSVHGYLTDDDGPTVSIAGPTDPLTETEGNTANYTVTLSAPSVEEVVVNYTTENGTATGPDDFTSVTGQHTFTVGATSFTFSVTIRGDVEDETDESFKVKLGEITRGTASTTQNQVTTTIDDNDGPTLSIGTATVVEESDGNFVNLVFPITLSALSPQDVRVRVSTADGTARVVDQDYVPLNNFLVTIPQNTLTGSVTVQVRSDEYDEVDEVLYVNLSAPEDAVLGTETSGTGTIDDDDGPGIRILPSTAMEDTGSLSFTIELTTASPQPITVRFATARDTNGDHPADAPADYQAVTNRLITIPANTPWVTTTVELTPDELDEFDETFLGILSTPTDARLLAGQSSVTGTIFDDDASPEISVIDRQVDEDGHTAVVTVSLNTVSGRTVFVTAATQNGTAQSPNDYHSVTQPLEILAGELTATISVPIQDNYIAHADKSFTVELTNPEYASLGDPSGTVTIVDNEMHIGVEAIDNEAVEGATDADGKGRLRVWLTGDPNGAMFFNYLNIAGSAWRNADYISSPNLGLFNFSGGTIVIWGGQFMFNDLMGGTYVPLGTEILVEITAIQDNIPDPNENIVATVVSGQFYSAVTGYETATIVIRDNTPFEAQPDEYAISEDSYLAIASAGILANDNFGGLSTVVAELVGNVEHGTLTLHDNGGFDYSPNENFFGADSFSYRLRNNATGATSNSVTVTINVSSVNDVPSGQDDTFEVLEDGALPVDASRNVLSNDSDVEGAPLSVQVVTEPAHGLLTLQPDGQFSYTPNGNYFGSDSFTYRISDGPAESSPVTVTLNVLAVNDAPSFTKGADASGTVNILRTIAGWATSISVGPANELGQEPSFLVTTTSGNNAFFAVDGLPAVDSAGTLTFKIAFDSTGSEEINIRLQDDGGTDNGGVALSPLQTFTISVESTCSIFGEGEDAGEGEGEGVCGAAPVIEGPSIFSTGEHQRYFFKNSGNPIQVSDTDSEFLYLDLQVNQGKLDVVKPQGNQAIVLRTDRLRIQGPKNDVNAILDSLEYSPSGDEITSATLIIEASDGSNNAVKTVNITIDPENDTPFVTLMRHESYIINGGKPFHPFGTILNDSDAGNEFVRVDLKLTRESGDVSANSITATYIPPVIVHQFNSTWLQAWGSLADLNSWLVEHVQINFGGDAVSRLKITINDLGHTPGPPLEGYDVLTVGFNDLSQNDPPEIVLPYPPLEFTPGDDDVPHVTLQEDTAFTFTETTRISVLDPDSGDNDIVVDLNVGHGVITVLIVEGVDFYDPEPALIEEDGTYTARKFKMRGPVDKINRTLDRLTFTPETNYVGEAYMTIHADDLGYANASGLSTGVPLTDQQRLKFIIEPVNDAPVNNYPDDPWHLPRSATAIPLSGLSVSDVDVGSELMSVYLYVGVGSLQIEDEPPTSSLNFENMTLEDINEKLARVKYIPTPCETYDTTLSIYSDDLGHTGSGGDKNDYDVVVLKIGMNLVGIFANDARATEPRTDPYEPGDRGQFTVFRAVCSMYTRSEELNGEITVSYEVVSNVNPAATYDDDYTLAKQNGVLPGEKLLATGTVTIPSGSAEARIDVIPFEDFIPDPREIVRVKLKGATYSYNTGTSGNPTENPPPPDPGNENGSPPPTPPATSEYYVEKSHQYADVRIYDQPARVTIATTDAYGAETNSGEIQDRVQFTISRGEGHTQGDLPVYLRINDPLYVLNFAGDSDTRAGYDIDYHANLQLTQLTLNPYAIGYGQQGDNIFRIDIPDGMSSVVIYAEIENNGSNEWDETLELQLVDVDLVPLNQFGGFPFSFFLPIWPNFPLQYPYGPYVTPGYKIEGSGIATATIYDDDEVGGFLNRNVDAESSGLGKEVIAAGMIGVDILQGLATVNVPNPGAPSPTYRGDDNLRPIFPVEWQFPNQQIPDELKGRVRVVGHEYASGFDISLAQAQTNQTMRFVLPLGESLAALAPTGQLDYDLQFSGRFGDYYRTRTIRSLSQVINTTDKDLGESAMGAGWGLDEMDRLYPTDGNRVVHRDEGRSAWEGMTLIRGDNSSTVFRSNIANSQINSNPVLSETVDSYEPYPTQHWQVGTMSGPSYSYTTHAEHATWQFDGLSTGRLYQVYVDWVANSTRTASAAYTVNGTPIDSDETSRTINVNQQYVPGDLSYQGHRWRSLGFYLAVAGSSESESAALTVILNTVAGVETVAGSVMLVDDWNFFTPLGSVTQLGDLPAEPDEEQYLSNANFELKGKFGNHYEFDARGLLIREVDRNKNQVRYEFTDGDDDGVADEVNKIKTQRGLETTFNYSGGYLQSIVDFAERHTTYAISGHQLSTITLPAVTQGQVGSAGPYSFGYDGSGLLNRATDPNGNASHLLYASSQRIDTGVLPDGKGWKLTAFLTDGLPTSDVAAEIRKPVGGAIGNRDDGADFRESRAKFRDPRSMAGSEYYSTYQLDAYGLTTAESAPATAHLTSEDVWLWDRRPDGLVNARSQPAGGGGATPITERLFTEYTYDAKLNRKTAYYADNYMEEWNYDATFNQLTSFTSRGGIVTSYELDDYGNAELVTENSGGSGGTSGNVVTRSTWFSFTLPPATVDDLAGGLVAEEIVAYGTNDEVTTLTEYYQASGDHRIGLVKEVTYAVGTPEAGTVKYDYDAWGNRNSFRNERGVATNYFYNELNQLVKILGPAVAAGRAKTEYFYDGVGNLRITVDPRGASTELIYDAMNRVKFELLPVAGGSSYSSQWVPITSHIYDENGNLRFVNRPDGTTSESQYDERNQKILDKLPSAAYSNLNLLGIRDPGNLNVQPSIEFRYDVLGNLKSQTDARADFASLTTEYSYDKIGQLWKTVYPSSGTPSGSPETQLVYSADGQVLNEKIKDSSSSWRITTNAYDGLERLRRVIPPADREGHVGTMAFDYDLRDNQTVVTEVAFGTSTVTTYDDRNRPLTVTAPQPDAVTLALVRETIYRVDGAVKEQLEYPFGLPNNDRRTTFDLDNLGRNTDVHSPDPDGNGPLAGPVTHYDYYVDGNVRAETTTFTEYAAIDFPVSQTVRKDYEYDNLGRLWKVLDAQVQLIGPQSVHNDRPEMELSYDILGRKIRSAVKNATVTGLAGSYVTTTAYDGLGRVAKVDGPFVAGTSEFPTSYSFYDQAGNSRFEIDPRGAISEAQYDEMGRLKMSISPAGLTAGPSISENFYTLAGDTWKQEVNGRITTFDIDQRGRVNAVHGPAVNGVSPVTTFVHEADGSLKQTLAPHGNTITKGLDDLHRVTSVTRPQAGSTSGTTTTSQKYNTYGSVINTTDEFQKVTQYEHNFFGQVTEVIPPPLSGGTAQILTQSANDVGVVRGGSGGGPGNWVSDALNPQYLMAPGGTGNFIEWTFADLRSDANYRVSTTWNADLNWTSAARYQLLDGNNQPIGNPIQVNQTQFPLEFANGILWKTLTAAGSPTGTLKIRLTSDEAGTMISATQIRLVEMSVGNGIRINKYSANGALAWTLDGLGNKTFFAYDALGRRTLLEDANHHVTRFGYDLLGRQTSVTDPNGNVTLFEYDARDNKILEARILPDSTLPQTVRRFEYDANDNLILSIDARGWATKYTYDALNQQVKEEWFLSEAAALAGMSPQNTITNTFDVFGRLTNVTDDGSSSYTYDYDDLDRMTVQDVIFAGTNNPQFTLQTLYGGRQDGMRVGLQLSLNEATDSMLSFDYDEQLRLKSIGQSGAAGGSKFVSFEYRADGRFSSVQRFQSSTNDANALVFASTYQYDTHQQLTTLSHQKGSQTLANYIWSYDANGRINTMTSADGFATYTYQDDGQLASETYNYGPATQTHDWDAAGNAVFFNNSTSGQTAVGTTSQAGQFNRIDNDGIHTYEYDPEGNRTAKVRIADGSRTEYDWDHRNRLVRVREIGTGTGSGSGSSYASGSLGSVSGSGAGEIGVAQSSNFYSYGSGGGIYTYLSAQGEGNSGSINFWADHILEAPLTIEYWAEDGSAHNYEDFILPPRSAPGQLTLYPSSPYGYVSFALPDDSDLTGTLDFKVKWRVFGSGTGSSASGSAGGGTYFYSSATLSGSFYGPLPSSSLDWSYYYRQGSSFGDGVHVNTSTYGETSPLTVSMWRDYSSTAPVEVEYWLESGSAQDGVDFQSLHTTVILDSSNSGWSWNSTAVINDMLAEGEESYVVKYRVNGGMIYTLTNTIVDDDNLSTSGTMDANVWISGTSSQEGEPAYFNLYYWSPTYGNYPNYGAFPFPVDVHFSISPTSGEMGMGDFSTYSFTVTIPANQTWQYFTLPTLDDLLVEGTETFTVYAYLGMPHMGGTSFPLTIADNDVLPPLDDQLRGRWEFNDNPLDSSGNFNNLTTVMNVYDAGITGHAVAAEAFAENPANLVSVLQGDFTSAFWFDLKPAADGSYEPLIRQVIDTGTDAVILTAAAVGTGQIQLRFTGAYGEQLGSLVTGQMLGWHQAAFVRSGGALTMYLDGQSRGVTMGTNGGSLNSVPEYRYYLPSPTSLDAAMLWSRALSGSEVLHLFQNPPPAPVEYEIPAAIADDEAATYVYQPTSYYVYAEGAYEGSSLRVYVSLGMTAPVDVRYTLQLSGSAAVMGRIPTTEFSITIPAWQSWAQLDIPTLDDGIYQGTQTVTMQFQLAFPHVSAPLTLAVNLGDDEVLAVPTVEYRYDYLNRLIGRDLLGNGAGFGTGESFIYDGYQVLARLDGSGGLTNRYLWGPQVDMLLADEQVGGELLWAANDHQNSVRDLVRVNSETSISEVIAHRIYSAFGQEVSETRTEGSITPAAADTIFGWTGRYFDDATGLQYNLNRWYDPLLKQWISEDPKGFGAGDPNLRRMVSNDPLNKIDPSGLDETEPNYRDFADLAKRWGYDVEIHHAFRKEFFDSDPEVGNYLRQHGFEKDQVRNLKALPNEKAFDNGYDGQQAAHLGRHKTTSGAELRQKIIEIKRQQESGAVTPANATDMLDAVQRVEIQELRTNTYKLHHPRTVDNHKKIGGTMAAPTNDTSVVPRNARRSGRVTFPFDRMQRSANNIATGVGSRTRRLGEGIANMGVESDVALALMYGIIQHQLMPRGLDDPMYNDSSLVHPDLFNPGFLVADFHLQPFAINSKMMRDWHSHTMEDHRVYIDLFEQSAFSGLGDRSYGAKKVRGYMEADVHALFMLNGKGLSNVEWDSFLRDYQRLNPDHEYLYNTYIRKNGTK